MRKMWEIKQIADAPNTLQIYIYGDIESDVINYWTGDVKESETSAKHFRDELSAHPDVNQIDIFINSYGGSVFEGTAIYSQLKRHPAHKTVYVDAFACSIASVIAMAGDEVVMPRNTMMMIHNMWMRCAGNSAELRKAADDLDEINKAGRAAYLSKAGEKLTEAKLVDLMDGETWLSAEKCIELGLADRFADKDADMTSANEAMQKMNLSMQSRIEYQKSLAAQLKQLTAPPVDQNTNTKPTLMNIIAGLQN